jgi:hypothetical protein
VPCYLRSKMENNRQFGSLWPIPYYSVQGVSERFSLPPSQHNGLLGVIVVAIGRISVIAESR